MIDRGRPERRAVVIVTILVLLAAGAAACGDSSSAPPSSSTGPGASASVPRDATGSGPTAPAGSRPPGTTVGGSAAAPRDGWNVVAIAPERYTNDNDALFHDFGQDVEVAFGVTATPVVAWASLTDSSSNGYTISASKLDPVAGWTPPTEVIRARLAPSLDGQLFTMAGNPSDGVVAAALERRDDNGLSTGVDVLVSTDNGTSWVRTTAVETEAYRPVVAVGGGRLFVAYAGAEGYRVARAVIPPRARADPPSPPVPVDARQITWTNEPVPGLDGFGATDVQPALAVDASGRGGVVTLLASTTGSRRAAVYTPLDAPVASKAIDVADVLPGNGSVGLGFHGDEPIVSASFAPSPQADVLGWVATSTDGGSTFSPAQPVPNERRERAPFGVSLAVTSSAAVDSTRGTSTSSPTSAVASTPPGRTVLVYEPDTANTGDNRCGLPRMVSSDDLTTWQACGAGRDLATPATAVQPANLSPSVVAGPDGGIYVGVTNRNPTARQPLGILVWRDP